MKSFARTTALVTLTALTVGAQRVQGRDESSWNTSARLDRGQTLKLTSPSGGITITQGDGAEVVVRAVKRATRGAKIEDIGFIVRRSDAGMVVCAVYEDDDECEMDNTGSRRGRNGWNGRNRASASFEVELPAGILVKAMTGSGNIAITGAGSEVEVASGSGDVRITNSTGRVRSSTGSGNTTIQGAGGPVNASTGSGDVIVSTSSGPVSASTGSGNISVSMSRMEEAAAMKFSTGSGDITLAVPTSFGAEFEATTGSGDITTELPITIEGRVSRNRMRGTIGDGGERLAMSTGSGNITVRKTR